MLSRKRNEYYANSFTGTDETCKPDLKKSEYNSENEIVRAKVTNKQVFQRYISKK